jgi:VWFA-related protein
MIGKDGPLAQERTRLLMTLPAIVALVAAVQAPAAPGVPAEIRSVTVSVTDEDGAPVEGLETQEVAVLENGVARDLVSVEADRRPLTVLLLVDSSEAISSSYRLNVVDAVLGFLSKLPLGTRYALWSTGDRPTKLVDFTDDRSLAPRALRRVFPQGGNTLLDALVEASRELKSQEGQRTAVVVVTATGIEFSSRDRRAVVQQAWGNADVFMAVMIREGDAPVESLRDYEYALGELTRRTGGIYETPLTAMAAASALQKVAADLRGQYRLRYATLPEIKDRKLEVRVARPGVEVRVGVSEVQDSPKP